MRPQLFNRRGFLATAGATPALAAIPLEAAVPRMDHQLAVLQRGPQNLQRKPSDYLRSIYLDIVSPLPEAMRFALDFSSADRLLFSSDHPWVQPKEILDPFRSLNLPAATEAKILGGNARQLFNL